MIVNKDSKQKAIQS